MSLAHVIREIRKLLGELPPREREELWREVVRAVMPSPEEERKARARYTVVGGYVHVPTDWYEYDNVRYYPLSRLFEDMQVLSLRMVTPPYVEAVYARAKEVNEGYGKVTIMELPESVVERAEAEDRRTPITPNLFRYKVVLRDGTERTMTQTPRIVSQDELAELLVGHRSMILRVHNPLRVEVIRIYPWEKERVIHVGSIF